MSALEDAACCCSMLVVATCCFFRLVVPPRRIHRPAVLSWTRPAEKPPPRFRVDEQAGRRILVIEKNDVRPPCCRFATAVPWRAAHFAGARHAAPSVAVLAVLAVAVGWPAVCLRRRGRHLALEHVDRVVAVLLLGLPPAAAHGQRQCPDRIAGPVDPRGNPTHSSSRVGCCVCFHLN